MFELAYALQMPVYKLRNEMPYEEYLQWLEFLSLRPVGWREDSRFMKILQAIGIKAKPEEVFSSLGQMSKAQSKANGGVPAISQSFLFKLMLESTGDKPEFLKELS